MDKVTRLPVDARPKSGEMSAKALPLRQSLMDSETNGETRCSSTETCLQTEDTPKSEDESDRSTIFESILEYQFDEYAERQRKMQAGHSPACKLPHELICLILSHITESSDLRACLLTCKTWSICASGLLWLRPIIFDESKLVKLVRTITSDTENTFPYSSYIRRLNLSYFGNKLTNNMLSNFTHCHNLERLTLAGCGNLDDESLISVFRNNVKLHAIDLGGLQRVTDKVVLAISESNPMLQGLNLSSCSAITDASLIAFAKSCPCLRRIRLSYCTHITDESIISLAQNCKYLLEIDVDNCSQLTNRSLQEVFRLCREMRELRLGSCVEISDAPFEYLRPETHHSLRILDLTGCSQITDNAISLISRSAVKLRNLVLAKCTQITDRGIMYLIRLSKVLHFLHLGHCDLITDRGITALAVHCTRLRYVDIACCFNVTDISVIELAKLPKLRRIGLVKCSMITDVSIYALADYCGATLERAHLSYCANLSLEAVYTLLCSCPHLSHMSVTGVHAFIRPDLRQFCRPSPKEFNANQEAIL